MYKLGGKMQLYFLLAACLCHKAVTYTCNLIMIEPHFVRLLEIPPADLSLIFTCVGKPAQIY